jgi:hypothetical protein
MEMRPDTTTVTALDARAAIDIGLRCPRCEYNLTGLTEPRCPECGTAFGWDDVRRAAACPPHIAFERARGWRKVPAFVVTWATVLFAPWIFARQIVQRASWGHALVFGALCFAGTALAYLSDLDTDFHATWLCTALIYVVFQTLWLSVLDPAVWQRPWKTLRFWVLVGCYTSAVMLTEVVFGPPPLFLTDLWDFVTTGSVDSWFDELFRPDVGALVCWAQLAVWIIGLCCIYARRIARRPNAAFIVGWTMVVGISLLVLYAATVQGIGTPLSNIFD